MKLFARSLWPERQVRLLARMALAILAAPFALGTGLACVVYIVAGLSEPSRAGVMAITEWATLNIFTLGVSFTLSFGLIGVTGLWAVGARGILAWLVTGCALGALMLGGLAVFADHALRLHEIGVTAFFGAAIMVLIRAFAGVRRG